MHSWHYARKGTTRCQAWPCNPRGQPSFLGQPTEQSVHFTQPRIINATTRLHFTQEELFVIAGTETVAMRY